MENTKIKVDLIEAINAAVDQIEDDAPGKLHLLAWLEAQEHNSIVEVEVPCMHVINHEHDMLMHHESCMHDMHGTLRSEIGLPEKVIEDLVNRYNEDTLNRHIEYTRFARDKKLVRKTVPAYFVASISGNWKPPKGFDKQLSWYSQEEAELIQR